MLLSWRVLLGFLCAERVDRAGSAEVLEDLFFQAIVCPRSLVFLTVAADVIDLVISAPVCFSLHLGVSRLTSLRVRCSV